MANAPYLQGTVSAGTTATLICSPGPGVGGVVIQNGAGGTVFLGGSTVTASGATQGISLAASTTIILPTAGPPHDLYAITTSGSSNVSYLFPV